MAKQKSTQYVIQRPGKKPKSYPDLISLSQKLKAPISDILEAISQNKPINNYKIINYPIIRFPRESNLSILNKTNPTQAIATAIRRYTDCGFMYLNRKVNFQVFSKFLGLTEEELVARLYDSLSAGLGVTRRASEPQNIDNTGFPVPAASNDDFWGHLNSISKGITLRVAGHLYQDRALAERQLEILLVSQNGAYKPFISGEVQKLLATMQSSTRNEMDFLKVVKGLSNNGQGNLVSVEINNQQAMANNNVILTTDKALELLQENRHTLKGPDESHHLKALYTEYNIDDTPEVKALSDGTKELQKIKLTLPDTVQDLAILADDPIMAAKYEDDIANKIKAYKEKHGIGDAEPHILVTE